MCLWKQFDLWILRPHSRPAGHGRCLGRRVSGGAQHGTRGTRPLWLAGTVCVHSEPFRGAGTRSGGGARGASPVHSRPQVRRQAGPAVRSVDGLCPRPELENCAREPPRAHHPLCETAVGRWPRPLGHVSAAAFLPAPPRPAEPVSLLSSAALRAPGACCPGPLRKSFAQSPRDKTPLAVWEARRDHVRCAGVCLRPLPWEKSCSQRCARTPGVSLQCQVLPSPWLLGMSGVLGPRLRPGVYESMWAW